MFKMLSFLLIICSSSVSFSCEKDLLKLLGSAKTTVLKNFEKGEPCYNAALIGRANGLPGCKGPALLKLHNLLFPIFTKAKNICQKSCKPLGKKNSCESLITQENLRQLGIEGIVNRLTTSGLSTASSFSEEESEPAPPVDL